MLGTLEALHHCSPRWALSIQHPFPLYKTVPTITQDEWPWCLARLWDDKYRMAKALENNCLQTKPDLRHPKCVQGPLATPQCPSLTFLSGVSASCQLLALRWYSSSNFMLMSSMDSWRRSQNPAKSWAVGLGLALGF